MEHMKVASPMTLGAYTQNFIKYVLTKVLEIGRSQLRKNFFLKFSEKMFKIILLKNVL